MPKLAKRKTQTKVRDKSGRYQNWSLLIDLRSTKKQLVQSGEFFSGQFEFGFGFIRLPELNQFFSSVFSRIFQRSGISFATLHLYELTHLSSFLKTFVEAKKADQNDSNTFRFNLLDLETENLLLLWFILLSLVFI